MFASRKIVRLSIRFRHVFRALSKKAICHPMSTNLGWPHESRYNLGYRSYLSLSRGVIKIEITEERRGIARVVLQLAPTQLEKREGQGGGTRGAKGNENQLCTSGTYTALSQSSVRERCFAQNRHQNRTRNLQFENAQVKKSTMKRYIFYLLLQKRNTGEIIFLYTVLYMFLHKNEKNL